MGINACFAFHTSKHADQRIQQRGVTNDNLSFFLEYADRIERGKNGCEVWTLSRRALQQLREEGVSTQQLERIARLRLIVRGGLVITVTKTTPPRCCMH